MTSWSTGSLEQWRKELVSSKRRESYDKASSLVFGFFFLLFFLLPLKQLEWLGTSVHLLHYWASLEKGCRPSFKVTSSISTEQKEVSLSHPCPITCKRLHRAAVTHRQVFPSEVFSTNSLSCLTSPSKNAFQMLSVTRLLLTLSCSHQKNVRNYSRAQRNNFFPQKYDDSVIYRIKG